VSTRADILAMLERHGLATRKALGQNFLVDDRVLDDIARSALEGDPAGVIEVGPGPGTLTSRLAARGVPVVAVEKDRGLVPALTSAFADRPHVRIVEGDALEVTLADLLPGVARPAVVGNVPYYITSPLLVALVAQRERLGRTTLMLQREVVDRLLARPGSKAYGSLSVLLQVHADLARVRLVSPGAFLPRPKVESAVISIEWLERTRVPVGPAGHMERVVRAAFGQRRKTLRNALGARFGEGEIEAAGDRSGLDLGRRAETLSLEEFAALAAALPAGATPAE
jgi:16S rRNA (adenine1518-N6/adenine1519-N6)-dimethyltransferase